MAYPPKDDTMYCTPFCKCIVDCPQFGNCPCSPGCRICNGDLTNCIGFSDCPCP